MRNSPLPRDEGFSLIETAIVLLIIGVLVGIAIPMYRAQADQARNVRAQALVRDAISVESAIHITTGSCSRNRRQLESFEPSFQWNQAGNPPGSVRIRMRNSTNGQEVCAYSQSESGIWFAIYRTQETTRYGRPDRLRSCSPNIARDWSPDGW